MQREGEFQKAIKRRGEKRTHLHNCLIPINVFSPSLTAFFFSPVANVRSGQYLRLERGGGGGKNSLQL